MLTMYGIPNCDSCRKARKWLEKSGIEYAFHDVRSDGLTRGQVNSWLTSAPWDKLLNTRSTTWRSLDDAVRKNVNDKNVGALLVEHPTLVKRPVLEAGSQILVGFAADVYAAELK